MTNPPPPPSDDVAQVPGRKPRPDRPTGRAKERADRFLEVATEVFMEKGYRNARLSDIVARAGGSLSTLYAAFGDKEGLAHAVMERSIRSFGEGLDILDDTGLAPYDALPAAAERLSVEMLSPERTVSHRIIIGEGLAFPELRDWFFEHGVEPAHARLADYFARQAKAGTLAVECPAEAANQFYMMVFGGTIIRSINGMRTPADHSAVCAEARSAAHVFLRGALPR